MKHYYALLFSLLLISAFSAFVPAQDSGSTQVQLNGDGSAEYSFYSATQSAPSSMNFSLEINAENSLSEITFKGYADGLQSGTTEASASLGIQNSPNGTETAGFQASLVYPDTLQPVLADYAGLLLQVDSHASGKDQAISAVLGFPKDLFINDCESGCAYNCSSGCYNQSDYFNCSSACTSDCSQNCEQQLQNFSNQMNEYPSNLSAVASAEDLLNKAFADALNESSGIETDSHFKISNISVQEDGQFIIFSNLTWVNASGYFSQALLQDDSETALAFPSDSYSSQLHALMFGTRESNYYSQISFDSISFNFSTTGQGLRASFDSMISAPPSSTGQLSYSSLFAQAELKGETLEFSGNMSKVKNLGKLISLFSASELRQPIDLESFSAKIQGTENESIFSIDMNLSGPAKKQGDTWTYDLASLSPSNETQLQTSDLTLVLPKGAQIISSPSFFKSLEPIDGRPALLLPAGKYPIDELKISYRMLGGISNDFSLPVLAIVLLASICAGVVFMRSFKRN